MYANVCNLVDISYMTWLNKRDLGLLKSAIKHELTWYMTWCQNKWDFLRKYTQVVYRMMNNDSWLTSEPGQGLPNMDGKDLAQISIGECTDCNHGMVAQDKDNEQWKTGYLAHVS